MMFSITIALDLGTEMLATKESSPRVLAYIPASTKAAAADFWTEEVVAGVRLGQQQQKAACYDVICTSRTVAACVLTLVLVLCLIRQARLLDILAQL